MALPIAPLATATLEIGGEIVEYRSMSRAQALKLNGLKGREDEAEILILTSGTGCTEDEAQAFREGNDTDTAGLLIDSIIRLSGLETVRHDIHKGAAKCPACLDAHAAAVAAASSDPNG
jgi:hypothetical protein